MKKILVIFCCFLFISLAFANVDEFVLGAQRGVLLFGRNVMPVLFPFFFVTGLLVEIGFFSGFRRFGVAVPVFTLSFLGGYPTGARMLAGIYNRGEISRTQAIQISTFTSTCSPIFIIATVGACFYKSTSMGIFIFVCHSVASVINGLLYYWVKFKENDVPVTNSKSGMLSKQCDVSGAISNSLYSAVQNILATGGLIIMFFIFVTQIQVIFDLSPALNIILGGIFELTNGINLASVVAPSSVVIPCAIVSFGGLAVAMQGFLFLRDFRMPFWFYMLYKTTHTIIAVLLCAVLLIV